MSAPSWLWVMNLFPSFEAASARWSPCWEVYSFTRIQLRKIWEKLRGRIKALFDTKITETQMDILRKKIRGLHDNMENYTRVWEDYKDSSGEEQMRARDTLKTTHIAFLSVVRAAVPEFRVERFAVPSLPLFALAANVHLMLLSDGIRHGIAWGYSEKNVNTMRAEFKKKTSPQGVVGQAARIASEQSHLLKGAIATAIDLEMPTNMSDTWKDVYSDLAVPASGSAGNEEGYDDLDYATYAYKVYRKGRGQVKPYRAKLNDADNRGSTAAAALRAYADYDSGMVMNMLNYAEYWPYLAGDKMPEYVLKRSDREIFFGPYGRHTTNATWSESSEAPITDRGPRITSAVYYGQKLGKVKFWNNNDKALECGSRKHGSYYGYAAPPGYRLTSVHITKWERFTPPCCEGIILGFRPSIIEFTPN
ncbi:Pesticidal crystal protein Cry3Ba [Fusarium oxysporum f. sp. raphani]|uniref:Pesticidal crystal protein Cry3Ba n=1 Tax=Fusarium oxysporum f. sp. raphani TaxID=96318 RepID=A0A8J5PT61_FUSOX|nr:Pesticidal crystal protein Cry3Ba [Fusarium oxysporum f. sp. raphani]